MKNRFVKITLTLTMLLVLAVPAQVFAEDKNCTQSQSKGLNTNISKIYRQLPQSAVNNLKGVLAQYSAGKIDAAQLQNLCNQLGVKAPAITSPVKPATPAATVKPTVPTAPVKPTAPAAPVKPTVPVTPAQPTTPAPTAPAQTTTPAPTAPAQPTTPTTSIGAYEQQVVDLVNKERAAAGLPALKVNTKLSGVAEKKAEDMRDKKYFSHTSPTYGSPFDMMKQFGISYTTAGENIAKGQKTPAAVMNGWMNSEGHRANILNSKYTEIGVGYVTDSNGNTYWVQHFIRP